MYLFTLKVTGEPICYLYAWTFWWNVNYQSYFKFLIFPGSYLELLIFINTLFSLRNVIRRARTLSSRLYRTCTCIDKLFPFNIVTSATAGFLLIKITYRLFYFITWRHSPGSFLIYGFLYSSKKIIFFKLRLWVFSQLTFFQKYLNH